MTGLFRESPISQVTVVPAHPSEYAAVRALIIQGLTARWGSYVESVNSDLLDFAKCYQQAVILVAKIDATVIGCGILMKESNAVGRIVRMTVRADYQRSGVGGNLMAALVRSAKLAGYLEVQLETTATWQSAVAFCSSCGFVPVKVENGDQHYRLVIVD